MSVWAGAPRAAARQAVLACAIALTACGGGGGGGADGGDPDAGPPSRRETPLAISTANAGDVAAFATGYAESALTLGLAAADWLDELRAARQARLEGACSNVNSARSVVLTDRDGNGTPSPGDRVDVSLTNCFVEAFNLEPFSGTLSIDLAVPPSAAVRWSGTVNLGSAFGIDAGPDGALRLGGSLRFDASVERLGVAMRVQSAATPLKVEFSLQGLTTTDVLTQIDAVKQTRRDTARATATFGLRIASDVLGGAITVATETPFRAWFDTFPDQGVIVATGANGVQLRVSAQGSGSQSLAVTLGNTPLGTVQALEGADGYLWSGTGIVPRNPSFVPFVILTEVPDAFKVVTGPAGSSIAPSGSLVWQFSRPLAADTPTTAEFRASTPSQMGVTSIAATATVEGALLTVTPSSQLEPGVTYGLLIGGQFAGVRAENGSFVSLQSLFTAALTIDVGATVTSTRQLGNAALLYGSGGRVSVQASSVTAAGLAVDSVQWRQLSGPPLLIDTPTSPSSTVRLSPQAAGAAPAPAELEVQMRASNGDIDRARVQFQVIGDARGAVVVGYRAGTGGDSRVFPGPSTPPDGTPYPLTLHSGQLMDSLVGPRVFIRPPAGITWGNGMVWNINRSAGSTDSYAWQAPDNDAGVGECEATTGTVTVTDFGTDGSGRLNRLALDYTFHCGAATVQGWMRMFTAAALPQ